MIVLGRRCKGITAETKTEDVSRERIRTGTVHCNQGRKFSRENGVFHSGLHGCRGAGVEALRETRGPPRNHKTHMDFFPNKMKTHIVDKMYLSMIEKHADHHV